MKDEGSAGDIDSRFRNFAPGPLLPETEPPDIATGLFPWTAPGDSNAEGGTGDLDSLFRNLAPVPFGEVRDEKKPSDIDSRFVPCGDDGGEIDGDMDRAEPSLKDEVWPFLLPRDGVC